MFCPQCGLESQAELNFCRSCGANLKVIGKAVVLSEAIARSDGVPAKIKEMVQNLKVEKVTEEVSRAMDKMNREIERTAEHSRASRWRRKQKTAAERRESMLTRGFIKLGSGAGFMLFLYFLSHAIVLRLDPDIINKVPFDIPSVVRVVWLIGLIPVLSGLGHLFAGLTIKPGTEKQIEFPTDAPLRIDPPLPDPELTTASARQPLTSVTERTTNILDRDQPLRKSEAR
jgi:hypothetical protein